MKTISIENAQQLVTESERLSRTERLSAQKERLRELIRYVRTNSPYLQKLYENLPEDFELQDLPVTQKAELLSHYNDWVTDRELTLDAVRRYLARDTQDNSLLLGKYTALQTSGSTGQPLPMVRDDYHNKIHGALLRTRLFHGVPAGLFDHSKHKTAFVVHVSNSASSYGSYLKMRKLRPGFEENIIALPIMDSIDVIVEKLNTFQPEIIVAYPPVLVMLAEEKQKGRLQIPLKLILSSAELLTEESYHRIHRVFQCPVLNNYCMTEGGELAMTHDCPHLHINEDFIIIEPVDSSLQPQMDKDEFSSGILVTDLTNYVQPIIRYYVSDSVRIVESPSDCYDYPILEIRGRVWEAFEIGGKKFTSKTLETKVKFQPGLCGYQFLQTGDNTMELRGVCAAGTDPDKVLGELAEKLTAYFEASGCSNVTVSYSTQPMLQNENGGKTPIFKKI